MFISTALLLLVIAVSLDNFTVGVTYGMKKVKIPFTAILVIMICSACVVMASMTIGHILRLFISESITSKIGGFIFILIGCVILYSLLCSTLSTNEHNENEYKNDSDQFKTVLKSPEKADLDKSGTISLWEAALLGVALTIDAFGAGIGAALLGFSTFMTTTLIAIMSGLFLFTGCQIGFQLMRVKVFQKFTLTPPLILISLGFYNIFL